MKKIDLTNQIFGYLTVINECSQKKGKRLVWHCKCQCGNEIDVIGESLRSGHTKSCGCLRKQLISNLNKLNLIGQKFGQLTVIEETQKRKKGAGIIWKCQCNCGNITFVPTNYLTMGYVKSCGCIKSQGQQKIINLLLSNNILFQKQYQVQIDSHYYYFDFAILNQDNSLSYLIEYDGIQHFSNITGGWNNPNNLEEVKKRDQIKNNWCFNSNIPLIRIPYIILSQLQLKDLKLDTSQFIIGEKNE